MGRRLGAVRRDHEVTRLALDIAQEVSIAAECGGCSAALVLLSGEIAQIPIARLDTESPVVRDAEDAKRSTPIQRAAGRHEIRVARGQRSEPNLIKNRLRRVVEVTPADRRGGCLALNLPPGGEPLFVALMATPTVRLNLKVAEKFELQRLKLKIGYGYVGHLASPLTCVTSYCGVQAILHSVQKHAATH